jgi:hypothetical protein
MEVTSKFHKLWEGYLRDRLFIVCFFAVLYYYASDQLTLVPGVRIVPFYFFALFAVAEILDREYSYLIAETFMSLSVHLAVAFMLVGRQATSNLYSNMVVELPNVEWLGGATAYMLFTVLIGFCIGAAGHMLKKKDLKKSGVQCHGWEYFCSSA